MAEIDALMQSVARLRVVGKSWEDIAELVPRAVNTMSAWPYKRAEEWNAAMVKALDDSIGTFESEALTMLRDRLEYSASMPSNREVAREAMRAAAELLRHARELRGVRRKIEVSGPGGGPVQLQGLSNQQLAEIADTAATDD